MQNHINDPLSSLPPHLHFQPPFRFPVDLFCRLAGGLQLPNPAAASSSLHLGHLPYPCSLPPPLLSPPQPPYHFTLNAAPSTPLKMGQFEHCQSPRKRRLADDPDAIANDPKRYRTTYSVHQSKVLEEVFQSERYISRPQRADLATQLQLPENTIKVWFQNRRMKEKRQSLMLPSIAGSDPQLRDTLMQVAKLYCDYQQQNQPQGAVAMETKGMDAANRTQTPSDPADSTGGASKSDSAYSTFSLSPGLSGFSVESLCPPTTSSTVTAASTTHPEKSKIFRPF